MRFRGDRRRAALAEWIKGDVDVAVHDLARRRHRGLRRALERLEHFQLIVEGPVQSELGRLRVAER